MKVNPNHFLPCRSVENAHLRQVLPDGSTARNVRLILTAMIALWACSPTASNPSESTNLQQQVGQASARVETPVSDRITLYLNLKDGAPPNARNALRLEGADFVNPPEDGLPFTIVSLSRAAANRVMHLPWVQVFEVDSSPRARVTSEIVPWGVVDIGAEQIQQTLANRGTGVKIAMLDDGILCSHPDLAPRVKGGYNFLTSSSDICLPIGIHGTKTAGVLVGTINGSGVVGVAPEADLYVLRVCDAQGFCDDGAIVSALGWARTNGMEVVSASLGNCGGNPSSAFTSASLAAFNDGIPQAFAAGNGCAPASNQISSMAKPTTLMAVSAYGVGGIFDFPNPSGVEIDLSAPTDVISASALPGGTTLFDGTSAATPHVGGTMALLVKAGFTGTAKIYQRLTETALDAGDPGHDELYGDGKVRASAAVVAKPRVTNLTWCSDGAITSPGTCSFTATISDGVAPINVKFVFIRSDSPNDSTVYAYGPATRLFSVPAGDYTLTVKTSAKEGFYLREGSVTVWDIPVCTGEALNAVGGCGSGGGGDIF